MLGALVPALAEEPRMLGTVALALAAWHAVCAPDDDGGAGVSDDEGGVSESSPASAATADESRKKVTSVGSLSTRGAASASTGAFVPPLIDRREDGFRNMHSHWLDERAGAERSCVYRCRGRRLILCVLSGEHTHKRLQECETVARKLSS